MATPLTGLQHREGVLSLMAAAASTVDPSSSSSSSTSNICLKNCASMSPILIFLFFHKAIRLELGRIHRAAMKFAIDRGGRGDIRPLLERYHFLRSIYQHHCNAEDEVIGSWPLIFVWSFLGLDCGGVSFFFRPFWIGDCWARGLVLWGSF